MKIRFCVSIGDATKSYAPGDEYDCTADEAERLIAAGFAEPVEAAAQAEPESAVEQVKSKGRKLVEKATAMITGKEQRG